MISSRSKRTGCRTGTQSKIQNELHSNHLRSYNPRKTPLLKQKHRDACLKAFRQIRTLLQQYTLVKWNKNNHLRIIWLEDFKIANCQRDPCYPGELKTIWSGPKVNNNVAKSALCRRLEAITANNGCATRY